MYRRRLLEADKSETNLRSLPSSPLNSPVIPVKGVARRRFSSRVLDANVVCKDKPRRASFEDESPKQSHMLSSPDSSMLISSHGPVKGCRSPDMPCRSPEIRHKKLSEDNSAGGDSADYNKDDLQKEASVGRRQQRRMLHELHLCMARSGIAAVVASASALSRGMDQVAKLDEVSKFRGRSRSRCERRSGRSDDDADEYSSQPRSGRRLPFAASHVVGRARSRVVCIAAQLSSHLQSLVEAIGEPPRRHAVTDETPLELLWAVNLLMLSILGTVLLLVMAFASQSWWAEDEAQLSGMAVLEVESIAASSGPLRLGIRVFCVAAVSFLSGICLRIIHPLQSALLCGV